jgi:hypothetical protein
VIFDFFNVRVEHATMLRHTTVVFGPTSTSWYLMLAFPGGHQQLVRIGIHDRASSGEFMKAALTGFCERMRKTQ